MKIEKISETQMRFTLTHDDLKDRNIAITELTYNSEKTQALFRDMMAAASEEYDFSTEQNTPLIIEAMPIAMDSIMVLVTKVTGGIEDENRVSLIDMAKQIGFDTNALPAPKTSEVNIPKRKTSKPAPRPALSDTTLMFEFNSLDNALDAMPRFDMDINAQSTLYKHRGKYYLYIKAYAGGALIREFDAILCEYGNKVDTASTFASYLDEHGECVIAESAIEVLRGIME